MKCRLIGFLLLVFFAEAVSPLVAQELTGYFTGTVTSIDDPANTFSNLSVGDFVSGTYSYDLGAADGDVDPGHGDYTMSPAVGGVSLTVGATTYMPATTAQVQADVYNDHPTFHDMLGMGHDTDASNANQAIVVSLVLKDTPEVWLSSDALPPAVPSLTQLTFGRAEMFGFQKSNPAVQSTVLIEMTALATQPPPIPAMSQWGLVSLTLLILTVGTLMCIKGAARPATASA